MLFMPFQVLGIWMRGLLALALLAVGTTLLACWYNHRETVVRVPAVVTDSRRLGQIDRLETGS